MASYDATQRERIETLRSWIAACPQGGMAFLGGAGVSTESGIPDFRSPNGLYAQTGTYPYPPEVMISRSFFMEHPADFFAFYCDRMLALGARPNQAHRKLAELEADKTLTAVITQNIDGLHQEAGNRTVLELHGSVHRNYCMGCRRFFSRDDLLAARAASADGVPRCDCGGIIKPDVVLYEEPLDSDVLDAAVSAVEHASLLVVAGTSLSVYPAARLVDLFHGSHLAIVNRSPTPKDRFADLVVEANVGDVFDF